MGRKEAGNAPVERRNPWTSAGALAALIAVAAFRVASTPAAAQEPAPPAVMMFPDDVPPPPPRPDREALATPPKARRIRLPYLFFAPGPRAKPTPPATIGDRPANAPKPPHTPYLFFSPKPATSGWTEQIRPPGTRAPATAVPKGAAAEAPTHVDLAHQPLLYFGPKPAAAPVLGAAKREARPLLRSMAPALAARPAEGAAVVLGPKLRSYLFFQRRVTPLRIAHTAQTTRRHPSVVPEVPPVVPPPAAPVEAPIAPTNPVGDRSDGPPEPPTIKVVMANQVESSAIAPLVPLPGESQEDPAPAPDADSSPASPEGTNPGE